MYIDEAKKPYPFCPGCSHAMVLDAIGRALSKIGADPKRTVLVSDIGCIGMSDKYFNVHTFHGLHGRSFTYACGIKLANPDLLVFNLVGDGGCGIGGNHLINAARRNIGIKVLCCNNLNFGMTGGQHSVTTPYGGRTTTTPSGSLEKPFDLAGLVLSAGAPFVARVKALDKNLDEVIAKAFSHEGFAFLDIWEICTAYYMPANDYKKPQMDALIASYGFKTGILREEEGKEYSALIRQCVVPAFRPDRNRPDLPPEADPPSAEKVGTTNIEKKFTHNLQKDSIGIVIAGSAGMKIISAAHNLGKAAISCDLWVSQKDDYPVTVQSGHSFSEIKISRERINYLGIEKPDAILIISQDGLKEVLDVLPRLEGGTIVIYDEGLEIPKTGARLVPLKFAGIDKTAHATAALARLLKLNEFIPVEAFRTVLEGIGKDKIRETNLRALEYGMRE